MLYKCDPSMAKPPYTGLICPKCQAPRAVILGPISMSATVVLFRCEMCVFEWVSTNQTPHPPPKRHEAG